MSQNTYFTILTSSVSKEIVILAFSLFLHLPVLSELTAKKKKNFIVDCAIFCEINYLVSDGDRKNASRLSMFFSLHFIKCKKGSMKGAKPQ